VTDKETKLIMDFQCRPTTPNFIGSKSPVSDICGRMDRQTSLLYVTFMHFV